MKYMDNEEIKDRRSIVEQLLAQGVTLDIAAAFAGFTDEKSTKKTRRKPSINMKS